MQPNLQFDHTSKTPNISGISYPYLRHFLMEYTGENTGTDEEGPKK